jgi:hypothetical protein
VFLAKRLSTAGVHARADFSLASDAAAELL